MTSGHSVSNHLRRVRDWRNIVAPRSGCLTTRLAAYRFLTGFAFHSQARPPPPTESSSPCPPAWADVVTDWPFSFRCSPPRIASRQLRFDTSRFFTARKRTLTALSQHHFRRTSADLQSAACRQRPCLPNFQPQKPFEAAADCKSALRTNKIGTRPRPTGHVRMPPRPRRAAL